jgi:hypothetical protein
MGRILHSPLKPVKPDNRKNLVLSRNHILKSLAVFRQKQFKIDNCILKYFPSTSFPSNFLNKTTSVAKR